MTVVKTKLRETKDKGIGLFADEFIPKGTIWWKDVPAFDKIITNEEYESYDAIQKEFVDTYIFVKNDGTMYMCVDNARFINHSDTPNTGNIGDDCLVLRDIQKGEELTCDYREICLTCVNDLGFENKE
jgi:SET domain-containing protein